METRVAGQSVRQMLQGYYKTLAKLTIAAGVEFWAITVAFSLLPIAAEFRAALSISYFQVVIVESVFGGLIIGCFVSYALLRFFNKIPTKSPILKSVILGFIALCIVSILVGTAASRTDDALRVFLIGEVLNVPRFLFLGVVIGYVYRRLEERTAPHMTSTLQEAANSPG